MVRHRLPDDDRGETLVEILLSVVILSILFVAILAALATAIKMSVIHRNQAETNLAARGAAEDLVRQAATGFASCQAGYSVPTAAGLDIEIKDFYYWDGDAWAAPAPCGNSGITLVRATVVATKSTVADPYYSADSIDVVLRKPCSEVASC